jgi:hypothetical protein
MIKVSRAVSIVVSFYLIGDVKMCIMPPARSIGARSHVDHMSANCVRAKERDGPSASADDDGEKRTMMPTWPAYLYFLPAAIIVS